MKHEIAVLLLWALVVAATAFLGDRPHPFTYLGPLQAIAAIGCVVIVRRAREAGS